MPANIRIIRAHEFIKATPEGEIQLVESRKMLRQIAAAADALPDYDILLDTRMAHSGMSITDLWHLAAELGNDFSNSHSRAVRTAILCTSVQFNHAEFMALSASNRGFHVSAFTSFEDAYEWLLGDVN